jgi:hypothetical protein
MPANRFSRTSPLPINAVLPDEAQPRPQIPAHGSAPNTLHADDARFLNAIHCQARIKACRRLVVKAFSFPSGDGA